MLATRFETVGGDETGNSLRNRHVGVDAIVGAVHHARSADTGGVYTQPCRINRAWLFYLEMRILLGGGTLEMWSLDAVSLFFFLFSISFFPTVFPF